MQPKLKREKVERSKIITFLLMFANGTIHHHRKLSIHVCTFSYNLTLLSVLIRPECSKVLAVHPFSGVIFVICVFASTALFIHHYELDKVEIDANSFGLEFIVEDQTSIEHNFQSDVFI